MSNREEEEEKEEGVAGKAFLIVDFKCRSVG